MKAQPESLTVTHSIFMLKTVRWFLPITPTHCADPNAGLGFVIAEHTVDVPLKSLPN